MIELTIEEAAKIYEDLRAGLWDMELLIRQTNCSYLAQKLEETYAERAKTLDIIKYKISKKEGD